MPTLSYREALNEIMRTYTQLFAALPVEHRAQVRQVDQSYFTVAIRDRQQTPCP